MPESRRVWRGHPNAGTKKRARQKWSWPIKQVFAQRGPAEEPCQLSGAPESYLLTLLTEPPTNWLGNYVIVASRLRGNAQECDTFSIKGPALIFFIIVDVNTPPQTNTTQAWPENDLRSPWRMNVQHSAGTFHSYRGDSLVKWQSENKGNFCSSWLIPRRFYVSSLSKSFLILTRLVLPFN